MMIWGIVLIVFGLATLIYMRRDVITEYEISQFFSKYFKRWQGMLVGVILILTGIAQVINAVR